MDVSEMCWTHELARGVHKYFGQFVVDDDVLELVGAAPPSGAAPIPARPAPIDHGNGSATQKP